MIERVSLALLMMTAATVLPACSSQPDRRMVIAPTYAYTDDPAAVELVRDMAAPPTTALASISKLAAIPALPAD